ncbi:tetratricopeptide repeat protein [candidate division WWE3 bacterium]|nr:tetratricopeptide repeat protein [candidate division WWE3 bacterium]
MPDSQPELTRQAINAAIEGNWAKAIELNHKILKENPNELNAKTRLGRAYLQISEFSQAKKYFREVLNVDPINQIALKNYDRAVQRKVENGNGKLKINSFIKEPGTYVEFTFPTKNEAAQIESVDAGTKLSLRIGKTSTAVYLQKSILGNLGPEATKKLTSAKKQKAKLDAEFLSGRDGEVKIAINASVPVFRGEKQEVRPYIKKGSIEEPELEILYDYEEEEESA